MFLQLEYNSFCFDYASACPLLLLFLKKSACLLVIRSHYWSILYFCIIL